MLKANVVWRGNELYVELPSPRFKTLDIEGPILKYNIGSFLIDVDEQLRRSGIVTSFNILYYYQNGCWKYLRHEKPLTSRQLMPIDRRRIDKAARSLPIK